MPSSPRAYPWRCAQMEPKKRGCGKKKHLYQDYPHAHKLVQLSIQPHLTSLVALTAPLKKLPMLGSHLRTTGHYIPTISIGISPPRARASNNHASPIHIASRPNHATPRADTTRR